MARTVHIPIAEAGPAVRDAMLREPRAVGPETTIAEVRETFANPRVKLLLVTDDDRFIGTLTARDLPSDGDGDGDGTIQAHVCADGQRLAPEDPVARAVEVVAASGATRIPVIDASDRLQGLVCFNRYHSAFCVSP